MKAIQTKYHGATNTRDSRISARAEGGHRISISYPHELNQKEGHAAAAIHLCKQLGWHGDLTGGGLPDGTFAWVFADSNRYAAN